MQYKGIVFSGLPGAGKSALVKLLADFYPWQIFSAGNLWRKRWEVTYPDSKVSFEEYWRSVSMNEKMRFAAEVDETYVKGKVIGDSRFTINLRQASLLLVFVTADLDTRAARALSLGKYGSATLEEIKSILAGREQDELRTGQELFGYDYRDPNYYHLVINSANLTIDEEAAVVESIVKP